MAARVWSVRDVLEAAEDVVRKRGDGPSRSDVARCLADALGTDRLALLLQHDRPLSTEERSVFRGRLERLLDGEPLAYVLGTQEFYSRTFRVDRAVLIPRPETEHLVEQLLGRAAEGARVFEPCTGSGCIAIASKLERPDLAIVATDVSEAALDVARGNARDLAAEVDFRLGSFWEPVRGAVFDALVANPPYVDPDKPELFEAGVARFEPASALFTPKGDVLHAYRALFQGGVDGLVAGAPVVLEVGIDTAEGVLDLVARSRNYENGEVVDDLAGIPRVVCCRRR